MSEFTGVVLAVVSAMAGGGLVWLARGRAERPKSSETVSSKAETVSAFDENLEAQLTRARDIPGAELLLDRLSRQPVIFARELADFAAQLDNLERKAKVEAARKAAFMQRMAPTTARLAKEAMAALSERRRAGSLPE